jgi:hypothetical protein
MHSLCQREYHGKAIGKKKSDGKERRSNKRIRENGKDFEHLSNPANILSTIFSPPLYTLCSRVKVYCIVLRQAKGDAQYYKLFYLNYGHDLRQTWPMDKDAAVILSVI